MAENKSHIGFFLNLDKPSDREVYNVLHAIPSYDNKTSYIKRAIMFYKRYCNDNNGMLMAGTQTPVVSIPQGTPQIQAVSQMQEKPQAEVSRKTKEKPKKNPVNIPKPKEKVPVETPPKAEEEQAEKPDNALIMSNNSDIDETIDYTGLVEGFFK